MKKQTTDRLDGYQSSSDGLIFPGMLIEVQVPVRGWCDKVCQYSVAREYNIQDIMMLPRLPSTWSYIPSKIFSGFQNCGKEAGENPSIDIKISGSILRPSKDFKFYPHHHV